MKNQLKTIGISYTDPKIASYIEEENVKGKGKAKQLGSDHVLEGKPQIKGGKLNLYTEPIYTFYNRLLADLNDRMDSKLQIQLGAGKRNDKIIEDNRLLKEIADVEVKQILSKRREGGTSVVYTLIKFSSLVFLCLGIFLADWLYLSHSLQVVAGSFLSSLILGLGIAAGNLIVCHLGESWIENNVKTGILRKLARFFLLILFLSLFIGLGLIRQQYSQETTHTQSPLWIFVGVNLVLFIALFLIIQMSLKPLMPEIRETIQEFRDRIKALRRTRKIIKLNDILVKNRNDLNEYLVERIYLISFHKSMEEKIDRYYYEALALYKETIINGSKEIPECLNDEAHKLDFFTQEIDITKP